MKLLESLNLDIQYKKEVELVTADALSQLCQLRQDHPDLLDPDWPNIYTTKYKTRGKDPNTTQITHDTLVRNETNFHVSNRTVYRVFKDKNIPYISLTQQLDTILQHHRLLGQNCLKNLYEVLKSIAWWPNLKQDIKDVLRKCSVCKRYTSTNKPTPTVNSVADPKKFKVWGLDVVGPLPKSSRGQRFFLVTIDFATRWPVCRATKDHSASTINYFINQAIIKG